MESGLDCGKVFLLWGWKTLAEAASVTRQDSAAAAAAAAAAAEASKDEDVDDVAERILARE